ncbi:Crp/Fnr family transcriptional regulator [Microbacteriaceae bacterium 4G12]
MKKIKDASLIQYYIEMFSLDHYVEHQFYQEIQIYELQPGEILCEQEQMANYMYFLCKGKVKIFTLSEAGKRLVVAFNQSPEVFGDIEYVQHNAYMNTIEALTPSHVMKIPFTLFSILEKLHPEILHFLLESVTRKFYTKSKTLSFHLLNEVDVRLASYLLSITTGENGEERDILSKYELREIAEFIGTSSRHLNRVIKDFAEKKIVQREHGSLLILNRQALIEKACGNVYEIQ